MVLTPVVLWDFAESDGGLMSQGDIPQWEWGVSTVTPDPVWKTRLTGPYLNDGDDGLILELPDLGGYARPVIVVSHQWDILPGDRGTVELDSGSSWHTLAPVYGFPDPAGFVGDSGGALTSSFRLDGVGGPARLRFLFSADETFTAAGWTITEIALYDGDATPPRVLPLQIPADTNDVVGPYLVKVTVDDDTSVSSVDVHVRVDGGTQFTVPAALADGVWTAGIPAQAPTSFVEWYAEASDGALTGRWPERGDSSFRVFLPSPSGLRAEGRLVGQSVTLAWNALDVNGLTGYEVEDLTEERRISSADAIAVLPVETPGAHQIRVRGVFDVGVGDWSASEWLDIEVPQLTRLFPTTLRRGDLVHLDIGGTSLYLEDDAALDLGDGILVREMRVLDVGKANAVLQVSTGAAPGPRVLTLASAWGSWVFPGVVSVGTEAPAEILSIEPGTVAQGLSADIVVTASEAFAGPLTQIGSDPGVLVTVAEPRGDELALSVVVGSSATPGKHNLVLDDGVRWWTIPVEVTERTLSQRTCSHTGVGAFPAVFFALLAVRRRRALG